MLNNGCKLAIQYMSDYMLAYVGKNNFWYASAGEGKWMDAESQVRELSSMSKDYIGNCINMIEHDIDQLKRGRYDNILKDNFRLQIRKLDTNRILKGERIIVCDEALTCIKDKLIDFLNEKKEELESI